MIDINDEIEPSPEYVKGFNLGYQCGRYEPETFNKVMAQAVEHGSDYLEGVKHGKKQFEKELILEQIKSTSKSNNKDRGR